MADCRPTVGRQFFWGALFFTFSENFKSWKCVRKKQASVRAPKSREREILIESTRYNELTYFP